MIWFLLVAIIMLIIFKKIKRFKFGCVNFITGAVKSGKSFFCVSCAIKECKKRRRKVFIRNIFSRYKAELPLLYCNIPLKYKHYRPLTLEIIKRKENIVSKSVVLIDECSLLADSMTFNDSLLNEEITLFVKLFGHSTHGGICFLNSQDLKDVHFSIKRSVSDIYYIENRIKLPFISIMRFKKFESVVDDNVEVCEDIYTKIIFNSTYKRYDCYCYSILTDDNSISSVLPRSSSLKQDEILSFKKWKTIKEKKGNEIKK